MRFHYKCSDCGRVFMTEELMYQCPECSKKNDGTHFPYGNLEVVLDDEVLRKAREKEHLTPDDFYPYPSDGKDVFPIGITPLMRPERLIEKLNMPRLSLKLDSQLISGSFKDRASYEVALQAKALGEKRIVLASTGNAGAAASAVGAAMGLDILLFVPASAPLNKLMQSVLYGAHVVPVKGSYDDAFALSIEYTKMHGGINRNTAYNPMTIEGKKSVSIELFEQMGRKVPDAIYVPVGDGCIIGGVAKGFEDLKRAGLIEKVPRLIACQSEQSDAISRAIENDDYRAVKASTRADSISVDLPANGRMATKKVKESGGWAVTVPDSAILDAQLTLTKGAGILAEPAAATAYAALEKDRDHLVSVLGEDAEVVVLITGTGFKDMKAFEGRASIPEAIENSVEALKGLTF
ncbi:MAG: pyridoxal-phosphate dependent enzyme [Spirochaetes bacterium]|uniref:Pyridoxal-phosphate dependent enzyme n=1 Tax=Candidatus Ornithospirochaeta stercoripullorum TaxID=2840899 RepID=A0A9D9H5A5_9SPIO|nr:pyridoxal-phosphate dependent enzyme [Candidatus Ornithospirochaeta stercoripullorum]